MEHKFTTVIELEVTVIAHVSPAVPPRPVMDPDHPAYSDPGDPGEAQVEVVYLTTVLAERIDITRALTDEQLDALAEEAYDEVAHE